MMKSTSSFQYKYIVYYVRGGAEKFLIRPTSQILIK